MANNSVFAVLARLLSGKPAFEQDGVVSEKSSGTQNVGPHQVANPYLDSSGRKIYPVVKVTNCHFHRSGDHAELRVHIHNESHFEVQLDKIKLFGQTVELDRNLRPHDSQEFLVYKGHVFGSRPHDKAELIYQILGSNDYFMNPHSITFRQESDGAYLVNTMVSNANTITDV